MTTKSKTTIDVTPPIKRAAQSRATALATRPMKMKWFRTPVLPLLMPLLWAAVLVLTSVGVQAGVVFTNLHSFQIFTNGENPNAVVQGSDGNFYGTTQTGGTNGGGGTVFKISTNGVLTSLYSFTGGNDGGSPQAGLVQGSDGDFYGTTSRGGTAGWGTVFKITTTGSLTSLYSFNGVYYGANPQTALVEGSDGNFYGTTQAGGSGAYYSGQVTVFRITTNGVLTRIHPFSGGKDGANPSALVQGSDGCFYGTTSGGGAYTNQYGGGQGTVFKIGTNGTLISLYSFTGTNDGASPNAGLV